MTNDIPSPPTASGLTVNPSESQWHFEVLPVNWAGHSALDIPDWTTVKNDAWIQNIVDTRGTGYLGSPQTKTALWDAVNNRPMVFAPER